MLRPDERKTSLKQKLIFFLQTLWDATTVERRLSFFQHVAFLFLVCFEHLYRLCFFIDQVRRKRSGGAAIGSCKVISVGNLTVGGTGKSVVVSFLVNHLYKDACVIFSHGYGRVSDDEKNLIVSDGTNILAPIDAAGDEPYMLAQRCGCSVIIGRDRLASCEYLRKLAIHPRYIILDDAYQNHQLKKDLEILLLDARAPFDNGYCIPAGRLRERDYHRADIIMLTHADFVSYEKLEHIKKNILYDFAQENIMCVKHSTSNILQANRRPTEKVFFQNKNFFVFAGIGSFDNFLMSVSGQGINVAQQKEFTDHYAYTHQDVKSIISTIEAYGLDGAITTEKDWYKIAPILEKVCPKKMDLFFVIVVAIEFLSHAEYSHFIDVLDKKI